MLKRFCFSYATTAKELPFQLFHGYTLAVLLLSNIYSKGNYTRITHCEGKYSEDEISS